MQEQLTPSSFLAPSPWHCPHSSACCCFGRRGIVVTPLHFPSWHPPPCQPNVLQLEKRVSSSFLCKELQYEYIFHMLTHKALGALDPVHGSSSLADLGLGVEEWLWSSSFSHSLPRFSHKENTDALLQAGGGLTDLSKSLPTTGLHRAIIRIIWTELQCDGRLLECVEPNENVYGCLGAQTISDCLSEVIQLY